MEFDRRVQVRVRRADASVERVGSGYLVAPRLVLTAAQVLGDLDPTATVSVAVCRPGTSPAHYAEATVRWLRDDSAVDAALLECIGDTGDLLVPESLPDGLGGPSQRYGMLIGQRPHPVTLSGIPLSQSHSFRDRFPDAVLEGTASRLRADALSNPYEITVAGPFRQLDSPTPLTDSPGLVGSAVFAHDGYGQGLLCGVMRGRRAAETSARLTATPASALLADSGFQSLIAEHTGWRPVLEPVEPASLLDPAFVDRDLHSPASLLRAAAEAVTFQGRERELADLRAWCVDTSATVAVRVVTGPGGQGKTRLARQLTGQLGQDCWATGHLRSDLTDTATGHPDLSSLDTTLPLLLVIDYAETRPRLLRSLAARLHGSRHRVRLLLLARSDGEWRTSALNATPAVRDLLQAATVTALEPLVPASRPTQDRRAAFQLAANDLARLLPLVPSLPPHDWQATAASLRPPSDLDHPRFDSALGLQVAALVGLLQRGPEPVDSPAEAPMEEVLLSHEERFWTESASGPAFRLNLSTRVLSLSVAVSALCGAATRNEAQQTIRHVPGLPADSAKSTAAWLRAVYPPDGEQYWGSLNPERIAEYHASRALINDYLPLPTLLTTASPGQQAHIISVLARAAVGHYNAGRVTMADRILQNLDSALDGTPLSPDAVQAASAALPNASHVTGGIALRLSTRLAETTRQLATHNPAEHQPELARALSDLGNRLSEAGQWREALAATEEAARIYQQLASKNPAAHQPDLARALSNLGNRLSDAGRPEEALEAERGAVELRRILTRQNSAAHEANLARSLSNFGNRLSETGRWREALAATEEAAGIYQQLASKNPAAHQPDLARSLANLGNRLSDAGRHAEALSATEQAASIFQRLARENPAAHAPDLARSLSNLSNQLADAGRQSEALDTVRAAANTYQQLSSEDAAAYEPDLARVLSNLGIQLAEAGRRAEALTATEHALDIYRRLADMHPTLYEPDLASSLSNLGARLSEAGRRAEALTATEHALGIYRRLADMHPTLYEPDLASSLSNHGIQLAETGRYAEALSAIDQAVTSRRKLAALNPAAHESELANSLTVLALLNAAAGRFHDALLSTAEAVEIYRRQITEAPHLLQKLHLALGVQAMVLEEVGRPADAAVVRHWLADNPLTAAEHD